MLKRGWGHQGSGQATYASQYDEVTNVDERTHVELRGISPSPLIMVHGPCIQHDDSFLRDEVSIIYEVLACNMWRTKPEGSVAALDFFDDCTAIW